MQAITTYYLPATNHKDARIVAKAARRIVLPWQDEKTDEENHKLAAWQYAERMTWPLNKFFLASGGLEGGAQVHVMVERERCACGKGEQ